MKKSGLVFGWECIWEFQHYNKNKKLIFEDVIKNDLADEGAFLILDDVLRADAGATEFYVRLFNDTPVKTDGLSDLTGEPSTNGYAANLIEKNATGWPTLALDSGDYQAISSVETFSASGGSWGPVTYGVLATTSDNSGKLISFAALSQSRTLADGETLDVTLKIKMKTAA